jgi:hypothetical protein
MCRTEFGRCSTSGFGQATKCFIAALCAFEDFAGDVPTSGVYRVQSRLKDIGYAKEVFVLTDDGLQTDPEGRRPARI